MDERLKAELTSQDKWIRLLFIVLYAIGFQIAQIVLGATVAIQFLWTLFTGEPNASLRDLGQRLGEWVRQIIEYATWGAESRPWPFGRHWPATALTDERDTP